MKGLRLESAITLTTNNRPNTTAVAVLGRHCQRVSRKWPERQKAAIAARAHEPRNHAGRTCKALCAENGPGEHDSDKGDKNRNRMREGFERLRQGEPARQRAERMVRDQ